MSRDSFIFYGSFFEALSCLEDDIRLQCYDAVIEYALTGNERDLNGVSKAVFALIKPQIDANYERYVNGCKGGRPTSKTSGFEKEAKSKTSGFENDDDSENQTITKHKPNDNDNENVNDNEKDILSDRVGEIVDYLNQQLGTKYKKSKSTTSQIKARLDEGHTVDDFKTVIDKKVRSWKDDPKMSQYLRPETLFRPSHFESYLNEIESGRASPAKSLVTDITADKYAKIHNFSGERKIDYEALGSEFVNL